MNPRTAAPTHRRSPYVRRRHRVGALAMVLATLSAVLFLSPGGTGAQESDAPAIECRAGWRVNADGGCELDVGPSEPEPTCPAGQERDPVGLCRDSLADPSSACPADQVLDAYGFCTAAEVESGPCGPGQEPDAIGASCVPIESNEPESASSCEEGFSLGADGVTCLPEAPSCGRGEVLDDSGECVKTFECPEGSVFSSDLLTCYSNGCPDGELLGVGGKRCVAPDTSCPDGTPRPAGGNCLVVETFEGENGTEVVVRCNDADQYCQARVKECADARAAGAGTEGSCEDPRASCAADDTACAEANERIIECASRGDERAARSGQTSRGADPCREVCPPLHSLSDAGECVEYLDPTHPCVSFGVVPSGVSTNRQLDAYSYLAGTGQCVTRTEFLRRLGNFEAAAGAEADALAVLRETTSEYLSVEEQLARLETDLTTAEDEVLAFTQAAADADGRRIQNERHLFETRKVLQRELEVLRLEVLGVYVTGGDDTAIHAALLSASDPTEISLVQTYGEALLDDQIDNIDRIRDLEGRTVSLGVELEQAAAEVELSLESAVASSADLESILADTKRLRAEQLARRNQEAEMVAELRENKGRFAQELGIFDQSSREIADIISESEFLVTEIENFDGLFAKPVIPATISSGFGPRLHPILGYVRAHNGLDFDADFGDAIYAVAPGIVQVSSQFGGYGETVVLDHGNGLLTLYAHMSVRGVEVGDEIERSDVIGFIGSTGLSTGPHLHFEVWVNGRNPVDPRPYLTSPDPE